MSTSNRTPLAAFHQGIRSHFIPGPKDTYSAKQLDGAIALVLDCGMIPGHRMGADRLSIEPALTRDSDAKSYALLVKKTAVKFPEFLAEDQGVIRDEIYELKSGEMCGG